MWWSGRWGTALVLLTGNQPQDTREKQAKKQHSRPQSKWKHRIDIHHYREGTELFTKCINREAWEAPDVLVNCTVQICAAHTPQLFLKSSTGDQAASVMGNLGSGPDRLSMYCPLGVVIQLGPIDANCTSSKSPSQSPGGLPSAQKGGSNSKGCSLLPSSWLEEL